MQEAPVEVGEILAGKFKVERILGVGGMGVVVAAMHLHLDKRVALKFMLEGASKNEDVAARFLREAKAAAKLRSQHIAQVLDVGTMDSGAPYMVLEYLEGGDLEQLIDERGSLPSVEAVDYLLQACLGMAEAHSHGIVHRDLKPPNLFRSLGPDGQPLIKILDFGIAKAAIDGIATSTQAVMGSPFYMSPEQWQGAKAVDERGDIWALGAILQYLLSGSPPFQGESLPVLFAQIATEEPASLASPELNVPERLQAVIRKCLEKKAANRPQNVAELALLLAPFGSDHADQLARKARRLMMAGPRASSHDGESDDAREVQQPPEHTTGARFSKTVATNGPGEAVGKINQATTMSASTGQVSVPPSTSASFEKMKPKWVPVAGVAAAAAACLVLFIALSGGRDGENANRDSQNAAVAAPAEPTVAPVEPAPAMPAMSVVTISTEPAGAQVRVNGEPKGVSPIELDLAVGSQVYLSFDLEGYAKFEKRVAVERPQEDLSFPLELLAAKPSVTAAHEKKRVASKPRVTNTAAAKKLADAKKIEDAKKAADAAKAAKAKEASVPKKEVIDPLAGR